MSSRLLSRAKRVKNQAVPRDCLIVALRVLLGPCGPRSREALAPPSRLPLSLPPCLPGVSALLAPCLGPEPDTFAESVMDELGGTVVHCLDSSSICFRAKPILCCTLRMVSASVFASMLQVSSSGSVMSNDLESLRSRTSPSNIAASMRSNSRADNSTRVVRRVILGRAVVMLAPTLPPPRGDR